MVERLYGASTVFAVNSISTLRMYALKTLPVNRISAFYAVIGDAKALFMGLDWIER